MHGRTGHSYTKHRHKQLQSHFSTSLHNMFTHSLVDEETQRRLWTVDTREQWVSEWVHSESDDVEEKDQHRQWSNQWEWTRPWLTGPVGHDGTNGAHHHPQHHYYIIIIILASLVALNVDETDGQRRLIRWEVIWDHGICFRNVNVCFFFFFLSRV